MPHFVVKDKGLVPQYLYHRRKTRAVVYEARAEWGPDVEQARVFTTRPAATNAAANQAKPRPFEVIEVRLTPVALTSVPVTEEPASAKVLAENDAFRFFLKECQRVMFFSRHDRQMIESLRVEDFDGLVRREHAGKLGLFLMKPENDRVLERSKQNVPGHAVEFRTEMVMVPVFALETLAVALGSVHWKQMLAK